MLGRDETEDSPSILSIAIEIIVFAFFCRNIEAVLRWCECMRSQARTIGNTNRGISWQELYVYQNEQQSHIQIKRIANSELFNVFSSAHLI
jgi:hypothetical protein